MGRYDCAAGSFHAPVLRLATLLAVVLLPARPARSEDPPLPDARSLVVRLIEHQTAVDEARENYTFKAREIEYKTERDGDLVRWKPKNDHLWQVYPSRQQPIQRLLEKNGRPLTAKQERKEDERIEKEIRDGEKRATRSRERGRSGDDDEDPRALRLRDVLAATQLDTVAREMEDGRELLAIDFRGNPAHRPRSRGEKIARQLEGRMWVDEQDLQVVRAEGRLGRLSIAGGIVAKLKEARFYFEQARVNGELWLPVRGEFEYRARILLVKGIEARVTADFFDYQRFGTETSIAFEGAAPDDALSSRCESDP